VFPSHERTCPRLIRLRNRIPTEIDEEPDLAKWIVDRMRMLITKVEGKRLHQIDVDDEESAIW
jgi:hypothetical protein